MAENREFQPRRLLQRLAGYARDYRKVIALALLCMGVHAVCRQFPIYATGLVIDKVVIGEKNPKEVWDDGEALRTHLIERLRAYADGAAADRAELRAWLDEADPDAHAHDTAHVRERFADAAAEIGAMAAVVERLAAGADVPRAEVSSLLDGLEERRAARMAGAASRLDWLVWISLAILATAILGAVTYYFNEYFFKWLATKVIVRIRAEIMDHLLHLPVQFFHQRKMGDLISRLTNDVQLTFRTVNILISEIVLLPMMAITAIAIAFAASWQLSLFIIPFAPLVILPVLKLGKKIKRRSERGLESLGETTEVMVQSMTGIRVVKAFQSEDTEYDRFVRHNDRFLRRNIGVVRAKALGRGIMDFIFSASIGLFLLGGGWLLIRGGWGLTPGKMIMFVTALAATYRPLRRLAHAYNAFQESLAGAGRIFEILDTPRDARETREGRTISGIHEGVRLEDVSFSYEDEVGPVLRGVSLDIRRGETVALVGRSGSGKSTLADLIAGFYDPTSGRITVDGVDLREIDRSSYLGRLALVSQQPFVFNASVAENIRYGRADATDAEVQAAARTAHVHDVISALPDGYDSVVGDRGAKLSGGELQRLTIARAVLREADLLILDEATSSLDVHNERVVQQAIDEASAGRTCLVIAHRLSTVRNADRIVVLEQGEVREVGTHEELMARQGVYAELHAMQG